MTIYLAVPPFRPPGVMTATATTHADSTPRRGFGLARFVLRAVAGAVEATRKAARSIGEAFGENRAPPVRRPVKRRANAAVRWHLVAIGLPRSAAETRRRTLAAIRDLCFDGRPLITLGEACRRFYLGTS